ncbi:MAG: Rod shape-determining protein MreD [Candidatus Cyclobacteriaceae bacterium M2_1C_046]
MVTSAIIRQFITFLLYILAQVWFFRNLVLFDSAFCLMYIGFLLLLPLEIGTITLMLIGFFTGLAVDTFYDSLGIHAAACVLIVYIRNRWANMITPQGGYDIGAVPDIYLQGLQWFTIYSLPLIFLHHLAVFFIEASGVTLFGYTISKVLLSTFYTFLVLVLIQYLFYQKKRI